MLKTIVAASLALSCAGCFSTWDLAPRSLGALNGYHEPAQIEIPTANGDAITFDRGTELQFVRTPDAPPERAKFSEIHVEGPAFRGVARDGAPVAVDLDRLAAVRARKYSPVKTGLAIGIPVGVAVILGVVGAVILAEQGATVDTTGDGSSALRRRR